MSNSREIKVSIAEDLNEIRNILVNRINQTEGMRCISDYEFVEDAQIGLLRDRPDVVIMDIRFNSSNITGIQCMYHVRRKLPHVLFLMFTEFDNDELVFDALKFGAKGYILKKDGIQGVISGIESIYNGGSPMNSFIARKVMNNFDILQNKGSLIEKLSPREIEVIDLVAEGLQNKEIADRVIPQIAAGTVSQILHSIYRKLEVNNRTEAVRKYMNH